MRPARTALPTCATISASPWPKGRSKKEWAPERRRLAPLRGSKFCLTVAAVQKGQRSIVAFSRPDWLHGRMKVLNALALFFVAPTLLHAANGVRDLNTPRTFPEIANKGEWQGRAKEIREHILVSCGL